ncbi:MAG TPA: right-handed parallel beta-helix repeat-containing protein, partial [Armatimonadota bacterium]
MKLAVAAALALSAVSASWGSALYVSHQVEPPSPDGLSWATAFPTVQQGIDAAQPGDEVWVAAGTYPENITLKSGVALYGGFMGNERSRDPRDPSVNISLLDGQSKGTVITIAANATSATVVDGFDIEHGYGLISTSEGIGMGGGVIVLGGTPIISNNIISNCGAQGTRYVVAVGGGIYAEDGARPLIAGNRISDCYAAKGGAIFTRGGLIRDNVFSHNGSISANPGWLQGGAIWAWGQPTVIVHNVFEGNSCYEGYGGAINCANGVVMDNLFTDNPASYGASLYSSYDGTIVRNTFLDDTGPDSYYEVLFGGGVFKDNVIAVSGVRVGLSLGLSTRGNYYGTDPVIANNAIVQLGTDSLTAVTLSYYSGEKPVFSNNIVTGWAQAGRMATSS